MRHKIFLATGIVIAILLIVGFFYGRTTPHYSLYLLKRAIENHDPDEALKYLNLDSIVNNLEKSFFGKERGEGNQQERQNPSMKDLIAEAMPGIKESIKDSFRASIAGHSGEKQKEKTAVQVHKNNGPSIGKIEIDGFNVRKLKETTVWDILIQKDGKSAMVSLKNNPAIKAKMIQTDNGYWQVVEIILTP